MALGHNRRFLPATADMKAMLADGTLGTLLHVEGNFSGPGARNYRAGMWRADRAESPLGGMGGIGHPHGGHDHPPRRAASGR